MALTLLDPPLTDNFSLLNLAKTASDAVAARSRAQLSSWEVDMIGLSRVVIVAGAAVAFAARSEIGPATAEAAPTAAATGSLVALSAPTPTGSCTVTPTGDGYSVTVTWSGFTAVSVELWQFGDVQPLTQALLNHPTRKGSITLVVTTAPNFAVVVGREIGIRQFCPAPT